MRVVVTGGGRGIGRAVAPGFAAHGARVAVLARTGSQVESVAGEIEELGAESVAVAVDVADEAALAEAAERVVQRFGGVDVLVNAAGVFNLGPTAGFPAESARTLLETNIMGTFLACKIFGRHLLEQGHGKVVNFCSPLSYTAFPERALYAASKGGVLQLTRSLGVEWAARNVNVLGAGLAARGHRLVYGAGGSGLMGAVARGAAEGGAPILGSSRSSFVALPGGYGTLDEVLEVVSMAALGQDVGPLVLLDVDDDWLPLLNHVERLERRGFVRDAGILRVARTPEQALDMVAPASAGALALAGDPQGKQAAS